MAKITIINISDPEGSRVGGLQTFLKGLIKYAPEDFDIQYLGVSSNKQERPPKKWKKLNIEDVEVDFYPLFFVKDLNKKTLIPLSIQFSLSLKLSNIEIGDSILFFNRIEPVIAFKKRKNPKIVVIHNDITKQIKGGRSEVIWSKFPWLYFYFEGKTFNSFDKIYTVSKDSLDFYLDRYPKKAGKFAFLPTWVDTEIFYPLARSKAEVKKDLAKKCPELPINAKWIIFVGRLLEQKAPLRLIDTFNEYHKIDNNSYFIILGTGNLEQKTKNHVKKLGLERFVHFAGFKDQRALAYFYRAADVMLLASNFEGMPICVLEALGSGLPVVSTNVGEVKRIVKNGISGEVTESFDPMEIARSLDRVLSHPGTYKSENCVNSILEYTPERVIKPLYAEMRGMG